MTKETRWIVIVIRAWRDVGGTRIRLVRSTDDGDEVGVVVTNTDDAQERVGTWLQAIEEDDGSTAP